MSLIHLPLSTASHTDLFFCLLCRQISGKRDAGDRPSIQLENEKKAFLPSWTVTHVAAVKRAMSISSTGSFIPTHGLCVLLHAIHSHRNRKALLNLSRSKYAEASKLHRSGYQRPADFALSPCDLGIPHPKEAPSYLIQVFE